MGSNYMILAKRREGKAWTSYQTEWFILALFVVIKRRFTHEIVDFSIRNFKD